MLQPRLTLEGKGEGAGSRPGEKAFSGHEVRLPLGAGEGQHQESESLGSGSLSFFS